MSNSPRRHGWFRAASLLAGTFAVVAMIIAGCEAVTDGDATIDRADAPPYRASVSSSVAASVTSSSIRESGRLVTLSKEAIHTSCEALSSSSVDAIHTLNDYVDAYNGHGSDVASKTGPAIDGLNRSADLVTASLSQPLAPDLVSALNDWVSAARAVADAIGRSAGTSEFNAAIDRMNAVKKVALGLCDGSY